MIIVDNVYVLQDNDVDSDGEETSRKKRRNATYSGIDVPLEHQKELVGLRVK